MTIYVVGLHDGSWGNTGNFNTHVFTDYELAERQVEWLEEHLALSRNENDSDPDDVYLEEFELSEAVDHHGEGMNISKYLYSF